MKLHADITIIKSQQGCGGTHLLKTIHGQLIQQRESVLYLLAESLCDNQKVLFNNLKGKSFLLIDDLDYLIRRNDNACLSWLKSFLKKFIGGGGKFVFSHTSQNLTANVVSKYIGNYSINEINCNYPSLKILKAIALQYVSVNVLNEYSEEAYKLSNNIRGVLNVLITYKAKDQLGLL